MRKPFEIGDKITNTLARGTVFTVVGRNLKGQILYQYDSTSTVFPMDDPSSWEHYVEPKVGYVNIYDTTDGRAAVIYNSRAGADKYSTKPRTACVKITYKEGQFDD